MLFSFNQYGHLLWVMQKARFFGSAPLFLEMLSLTVGVRDIKCLMEAMKSSKEQLAEGRQLEQSGNLTAAAQIYRKLVSNDPRKQDAVNRALVVYRKLKDYREELAVINQVLEAYQAKDKARQEKWVREHSKAAAAGAAVFQKLGGSSVAGFGADPAVATLMRRSYLVERKISGRKTVKKGGKSVGKPGVRMNAVQRTDHREKVVEAKLEKEKLGQRKEVATHQRRQADQVRKEAEKGRKKKEQEKRVAALVERRLAIERQKKEAAARKAEAAAKKARQTEAKKAREKAARKAAEERKEPSLFVVILQNHAPLEEIESAMAEHVAFLDAQYEKRGFLASGRQEPRVGWIILTKGKGLEAFKRSLKEDPLVRKRLVTVEVVEFKVSRMDKGMARYFSRKR